MAFSFPGHNNGYIYQYNIPFFDDIHNFFPDLLYAPLNRFNTAADILIYIREQVRLRGDRFSAAQRSMTNYYNYTPLTSRGSSPIRYTAAVAPPAPAPAPAPVPAPVVPIVSSVIPPSSFAGSGVWSPPPPPPPAHNPILRREIFNLQDIDFMDSLLNIFAQPAGTISIFGTTLANNLTPVVVHPTNQQITEATTILNADQTHADQQCTICFENLTLGQNLRSINHCHHTFHQTCIDRWFQSNVRCPNCRYDIRGEEEEPVQQEDDDTYYDEDEETE